MSGSGVLNAYYAGTSSVSSGNTVVSVVSITGQRSNAHVLVPGDMVLVMQMQDSSFPSTAGRHEYAQIQSISGTNLTLRTGLVNSYDRQLTNGSPTVRTFQLIWVPQHSALTIPGGATVSADRWALDPNSGHGTGGVVALDVAGAFSMQAGSMINAAGAGFRGGAGVNGGCSRNPGAFGDNDYNAVPGCYNGSMKGEGIEGTPMFTFGGTVTPIDYAGIIGQGYALGAQGRRYRSNAGGGGNDGNPPTGGNALNSGGGGGGNDGAGGQGGNSWNNESTSGPPATATSSGPPLNTGAGSVGNPAGGMGGQTQAASATRLVMGGGGGAGSANGGTGDVINAWPPNALVANDGAIGAITSSGASGGGIVLVRAGVFSAAGGATIDVSGYRAYDKYHPTSGTNTDGGGGGGAGGSVYLAAGSGSGANLSILANGGKGGSTNFRNHGPGGGGGGGFVMANVSPSSISVAGGASGVDGCCDAQNWEQGNGSPKPYGAGPGVTGTPVITGTPPPPARGVQGGASCVPALTLTKSTTTPRLTVPAATTAQYVILVANPSAGSGAAYGVAVRDVLPAPFGLATTTSTASYTVSGVLTRFNGSTAGVPNSSGVTPTVQFGTPGGMTNTFTLFPGGQITLTFNVNLNAASSGTYQNPADFSFIDPTRSTGTRASATNSLAQATVTAGAISTSGAPVMGANYASGTSTAEDVRLILGTTSLTISKTNGVSSLLSGQTTAYTITVANLGPTAADGSVVSDQASAGLSCTAVSCSVGSGSPLGTACPSAGSTTMAYLSPPGTGIVIPSFPALSTVTFRLLCDVTASGS